MMVVVRDNDEQSTTEKRSPPRRRRDPKTKSSSTFLGVYALSRRRPDATLPRSFPPSPATTSKHAYRHPSNHLALQPSLKIAGSSGTPSSRESSFDAAELVIAGSSHVAAAGLPTAPDPSHPSQPRPIEPAASSPRPLTARPRRKAQEGGRGVDLGDGITVKLEQLDEALQPTTSTTSCRSATDAFPASLSPAPTSGRHQRPPNPGSASSPGSSTHARQPASTSTTTNAGNDINRRSQTSFRPISLFNFDAKGKGRAVEAAPAAKHGAPTLNTAPSTSAAPAEAPTADTLAGSGSGLGSASASALISSSTAVASSDPASSATGSFRSPSSSLVPSTFPNAHPSSNNTQSDDEHRQAASSQGHVSLGLASTSTTTLPSYTIPRIPQRPPSSEALGTATPCPTDSAPTQQSSSDFPSSAPTLLATTPSAQLVAAAVPCVASADPDDDDVPIVKLNLRPSVSPRKRKHLSPVASLAPAQRPSSESIINDTRQRTTSRSPSIKHSETNHTPLVRNIQQTRPAPLAKSSMQDSTAQECDDFAVPRSSLGGAPSQTLASRRPDGPGRVSSVKPAPAKAIKRAPTTIVISDSDFSPSDEDEVEFTPAQKKRNTAITDSISSGASHLRSPRRQGSSRHAQEGQHGDDIEVQTEHKDTSLPPQPTSDSDDLEYNDAAHRQARAELQRARGKARESNQDSVGKTRQGSEQARNGGGEGSRLRLAKGGPASRRKRKKPTTSEEENDPDIITLSRLRRASSSAAVIETGPASRRPLRPERGRGPGRGRPSRIGSTRPSDNGRLQYNSTSLAPPNPRTSFISQANAAAPTLAPPTTAAPTGRQTRSRAGGQSADFLQCHICEVYYPKARCLECMTCDRGLCDRCLCNEYSTSPSYFALLSFLLTTQHFTKITKEEKKIKAAKHLPRLPRSASMMPSNSNERLSAASSASLVPGVSCNGAPESSQQSPLPLDQAQQQKATQGLPDEPADASKASLPTTLHDLSLPDSTAMDLSKLDFQCPVCKAICHCANCLRGPFPAPGSVWCKLPPNQRLQQQEQHAQLAAQPQIEQQDYQTDHGVRNKRRGRPPKNANLTRPAASMRSLRRRLSSESVELVSTTTTTKKRYQGYHTSDFSNSSECDDGGEDEDDDDVPILRRPAKAYSNRPYGRNQDETQYVSPRRPATTSSLPVSPDELLAIEEERRRELDEEVGDFVPTVAARSSKATFDGPARGSGNNATYPSRRTAVPRLGSPPSYWNRSVSPHADDSSDSASPPTLQSQLPRGSAGRNSAAVASVPSAPTRTSARVRMATKVGQKLGKTPASQSMPPPAVQQQRGARSNEPVFTLEDGTMSIDRPSSLLSPELATLAVAGSAYGPNIEGVAPYNDEFASLGLTIGATMMGSALGNSGDLIEGGLPLDDDEVIPDFAMAAISALPELSYSSPEDNNNAPSASSMASPDAGDDRCMLGTESDALMGETGGKDSSFLPVPSSSAAMEASTDATWSLSSDATRTRLDGTFNESVPGCAATSSSMTHVGSHSNLPNPFLAPPNPAYDLRVAKTSSAFMSLYRTADDHATTSQPFMQDSLMIATQAPLALSMTPYHNQNYTLHSVSSPSTSVGHLALDWGLKFDD